MKEFKLALLAAIALSATAARAQGIASRPHDFDSTINRHFGFFLRLDLGLGYMHSGATSNGNDVTLSGLAGAFSISLGGAVTENLIIGGHLWDNVVSNPSVSIGSNSGSSNDTTLGLIGFGPQVTYYFMPINIYLSGTAGVGKLTVTTNGTSGSTNAGFAGRLAVGKEWWVSDHWGLGVEGHLSIGINSDSGSSGASWTTPAFAIAFCATYN
jgi:hypothetical protein